MRKTNHSIRSNQSKTGNKQSNNLTSNKNNN